VTDSRGLGSGAKPTSTRNRLDLLPVIAGLDSAIHASAAAIMPLDRRVKPGDDGPRND